MKRVLIILSLCLGLFAQGIAQTWTYPEFLEEVSKPNGKTNIVYVYASWCGPCLQSFPFLYEIKQKHQADSTLQLWLMNTDADTERWQWVMDRSVSGWRHTYCGMGDENKDFRLRGYEYTGIPSIFWVEGGGEPEKIKSKLKLAEMLDERKKEREELMANRCEFFLNCINETVVVGEIRTGI